MQRLTITVDDEIAEMARAEVTAGRAPSMSAWVAQAIGEKLQAVHDLDAELDRMEVESPTTADQVARIAEQLGQSEQWVWQSLGLHGRSKAGTASERTTHARRSKGA